MVNCRVISPLIFISLIILVGASVLPAYAINYIPGVTTGQYVKYGNFSGNGEGFEEFNNYDFLQWQVTQVSGSQVTLLSSGQYKNGTALPGNGASTVWDIQAGTQDGIPSTQGPIIAANLNPGDAIPPAGTYSLNSTEQRTYLGVSRAVNVLEVSVSSPDYNSSTTYVYDKASGMLLEASAQTTTQSEPTPVSSNYSYSVVETNIFSSAGQPSSIPSVSILALPLVLVAVVIAAIIAVIIVIVVIALRKK